ncbi:MAG: Rieske 2Fe-2S domain-containing protein [Actinomycetota bacterium]|nr:Rieske 2Fe-2S domain-containing protein [Actinomycetota bacterium]
MALHRVPLSTLAPSGRAVVALAGKEIALFRVEGAVYAVENACPHEGNPLVQGDVAGTTLTCAYHLWRFDLETGACLSGDEPARVYRASVSGADVLIELPH